MVADGTSDWLCGRWEIELVGAGGDACAGVVWEFQRDGILIVRIPDAEELVAGYIASDPDTLMLLYCLEDDSVLIQYFTVRREATTRMFLSRCGVGERLFLFEANRVARPFRHFTADRRRFP